MSVMMQLRVWLLDSEPKIWRRLVVDPRLTLEQLHTVLQISFGWENAHLHEFHAKDGTRFGPPALDDGFGLYGDVFVDERDVVLSGVFTRANMKIAYEYDLGDSWVHAVKYEKKVDSETVEYPFESFVEKGKGFFSGKKRAAICIAGARNGPPEDCGGVWGYQHLLELQRKPPQGTSEADDDDRDRLEWFGDWDVDRFDLAEINQNLGRVRVKKVNVGRSGG